MQAALLLSAVTFHPAGPAHVRTPSRARPVVLAVADANTEAFAAAAAKADKKAALMEGLQREYSSFFQPMEDELYNPSVSFADPLITLNGLDAYRNNVNMLAGKTLLGQTCFSDCGLVMHNCTETADGGLQTRWTLQFRFKLLPWKPLAQFTGVSRYTLDADCRVLAQKDYWDSINLRAGGDYEPTSQLAALSDLLSQLAPNGGNAAQQASTKELPYVLLRRTAPRDGLPGYEVRRYPQHVSVATEYLKRIDAFGTLGAYTNGANEAGQELLPYVPSLMSVPYDERSPEQVKDDSLDLKPPEESKTMRWPMAVPALTDPTPPKPSGRLDGFVSLDLQPTRTVAVLAFAEPTTEPVVRGFHSLLSKLINDDGHAHRHPTRDQHSPAAPPPRRPAAPSPPRPLALARSAARPLGPSTTFTDCSARRSWCVAGSCRRAARSANSSASRSLTRSTASGHADQRSGSTSTSILGEPSVVHGACGAWSVRATRWWGGGVVGDGQGAGLGVHRTRKL